MSAPFYLKLIDARAGGLPDASPLLARGSALAALCGDLLRGVEGVTFDAVAGIEGLGFALGAAMATRAGVGFLALHAADGRQAGGQSSGQSSGQAGGQAAFVEAGGLRLRKRAASPGLRVLLVDDWIEAGDRAQAAAALLEGQGARIVAVAAIGAGQGERVEALMARTRCVWVWPGGLEVRGVIEAPDAIRSGSACGVWRPPDPAG